MSPVFKREVVEAAHALDAAAMPGCFTPTEILTAHEAGADVAKVFPAGSLGPGFIMGVLAPMSRIKRPVGERLALAARALVYGEEGLIYSGSRYRSHTVETNGSVTVAFDHAENGLTTREGASVGGSRSPTRRGTGTGRTHGSTRAGSS